MTGRPTDLTDELAERICEALSEGKSLREFCLLESNPGYSTVMRWLMQNEVFRDKYRAAREYQAHNDADRMNQIIEQVASGELTPDKGRVMMDGLKWTAGRRLPKVYGDKLALGGDADAGPIQVSWQEPKPTT